MENSKTQNTLNRFKKAVSQPFFLKHWTILGRTVAFNGRANKQRSSENSIVNGLREA